jgi:hypothetical protein
MFYPQGLIEPRRSGRNSHLSVGGASSYCLNGWTCARKDRCPLGGELPLKLNADPAGGFVVIALSVGPNGALGGILTITAER